MKFRVRIDNVTDAAMIKFCESYPSYVIVHHILPHGNPHHHAYIDAPMIMSDNTLRMRFKRYFEPSQRTDYSVKICDEEKVNEYVQYLFNTKHGNRSILVAHQYDNDLLIAAQKGAEDVTRDFEARAERRKPKGPTIYQLAEQVRDIVDQTHKEEVSVQTYTQICIDVLHKHRKTCEPNMLIKLVSTARSFRQKDFLVKKVQFYFQEQ